MSSKAATHIAFARSAVPALLAAVLFLAGCGGSNDGASESAPHINLKTGSANGVEPDGQEGLPPPSVKVADLEQAASKAGCLVQLHLREQKPRQLPPGSSPDYTTFPPTSGPYVKPPHQQADGAYSETPDDLDVVGALAHGRLAIQYQPDLPRRAKRELKGLFETMYGGVLLFPNEAPTYGLVATTWTNLLACPAYEGTEVLDAIRAFAKLTWGKHGPEAKSVSQVSGPTPAKPETSD